jgi:hypothetical protein
MTTGRPAHAKRESRPFRWHNRPMDAQNSLIWMRMRPMARMVLCAPDSAVRACCGAAPSYSLRSVMLREGAPASG